MFQGTVTLSRKRDYFIIIQLGNQPCREHFERITRQNRNITKKTPRRFIIAGKRGSFAARGFGPLVDQLLVPGLEVREALGVDDHRARVGGDGGLPRACPFGGNLCYTSDV